MTFFNPADFRFKLPTTNLIMMFLYLKRAGFCYIWAFVGLKEKLAAAAAVGES